MAELPPVAKLVVSELLKYLANKKLADEAQELAQAYNQNPGTFKTPQIEEVLRRLEAHTKLRMELRGADLVIHHPTDAEQTLRINLLTTAGKLGLLGSEPAPLDFPDVSTK